VYTASDNSRYEDSITVYAQDFSQTQTESVTQSAAEEENVTETVKTTVQETEEGTEESTETESTSSDDEEGTVWEKLVENVTEHLWIWIAGASAVVALIGVVIVLLIVKRRKKKRQAVSGGSGDVLPVYANDSTGAVQNTYAPQPGMQKTPQNATQNMPTKTQIIILKTVGYEQVEHRIELSEGVEVTIGRNRKADIVLDPEDKKLSGIHCSFKLENGKIVVCDKGSTNGTFVNGIPIQQMGRVAVHTGETIRMGSYEYRIC